MPPDRRRLVEAMGIGPLWVTRAARPSVEGDDGRETRIADLTRSELETAVAACTACRLCEGRTRAVFGDGAETPEWLIVGAGPDEDEDRTGQLFLGKAGRLLDGMLEAAGHSRRRDVFVTGALKCRLPNDRIATPAEIAACLPWLRRQIALLAPRGVVALGDIAAAALLGPDASVRSARGKVHTLDGGLPLVVTHDPATLLDQPAKKAEAWVDLCLARGATSAPRRLS